MIYLRLRALWLVPLVFLPALAGPGYGGIFFGKKNRKPTPAERVPELLAQVKSDGDESKRAAAAQELRQYDPAQFPMIVPVLVEVMLTDSKPVVRAEAAQSLGKIRPISQQAGMALEQALNSDASMRVRLQARSSLLQYHWSGYRSVRKDDVVPQTKEPPLADDKSPPIINTTTTLPARGDRIVPQSPTLPSPPGGEGRVGDLRSTSGYRPAPPPAPFPAVPPRATRNEPPLAPPANPAPPQRNDSGPDLTPP
jgi:HEAT repeat protein